MESLKGPKVLSRLKGTLYRNVALQKEAVTMFRNMEVFAILHLYFLYPNALLRIIKNCKFPSPIKRSYKEIIIIINNNIDL